jgi:para-nitrobenzyl esterase
MIVNYADSQSRAQRQLSGCSRDRSTLKHLFVCALVAAAGCQQPHLADPAARSPLNTSMPAPELAAQSGALIRLPDGPVQGRDEFGTRTFIGIPYAAAPVDALRWQPPAKVKTWSAPLDATGPGVACIQSTEPLLGGLAQSEDCLQLNVFAPSTPSAAPVPVMVWLHGGGNESGSANEFIARPDLLGGTQSAARLYDGRSFRSFADREVVVVTVNYRLGALGFLSHPGLTDEQGASGNYGLMDQQAALRWVQRNIRAFGGDPDRVTLFGQAAGAIDGCYQMVSEDGEHLFHAAVLESGTCGSVSLPELPDAESAGVAYAAAHGCDQADASQNLACLRATPAEYLVRPDATSRPNPQDLKALAVVDGAFLIKQPSTAIAAGEFAHVPTIIGNTAREAARLLSRDRVLRGEAEYLTGLSRALGQQHAYGAAALYPAMNYVSANDAAIALLTDAMYVCPARRLALRASRFAPVFLYSFDRSAPVEPFDGFGAAQGVDLLWVWNVWPTLSPYSSDEVGFSVKVRGYWTRLVDADVNTEASSPSWPRYGADIEPELRIDETIETSDATAPNSRKQRCAFWDEVPPDALSVSEILGHSPEATR